MKCLNIFKYFYLTYLFNFIIFSLLSMKASASEPKPWQLDLQEPAGIIASKATDLHNFLLIIYYFNLNFCAWFIDICMH
jgi:hypothetical protein